MADDTTIEDALNADPRYQALTGSDRVLKRKEVYTKLGKEPPTYVSKPGTRELNEQGPVHKYVRPLLESAGMIGGGMIGSKLGPIGAAAGGAGGYALGDTAASGLERLAGERPPVQSIAQGVTEAGRSLGVGAALEAGGHLVGRAVGAIGSKVLAPFNSQYEGANRTLDEAAKARGITLDPHEVLQNRPLALGHKVLENIPFTSGMIQRKEMGKLTTLTKEWEQLRHDTGAPQRQRLGDIGQKIQTSIERELDRIGVRQEGLRETARDTILRDVGSPLTYKELGEQSQAAIKEHHAGLKGLEDIAWEHARASVPEGRVVTQALPATANTIKKEYENIPSFLDEPLLRQLGDVSGSGNKKYDALVKQAQEQIPAGLPPAIRDRLMNEMTAGEQPGWSVESLLKLRSELSANIQAHHTGLQRGDVAKGSGDAMARVYTKLLKAVDTDLESFGASQGSEVAQNFQMARAASGQRLSFFNPKDNPAVMKAINSDPALLQKSLIKPGSAAGYTALKELVGNNAAQPVKQAFTNQLLKIGGKESEGLADLRRTLDGYGAQTIAEVYSPAEAKQLYALADRASWQKHSPIGNPFFRELVRDAPSTVAPTILEHPDLTTKVLRKFPAMRKDLRQAFLEGLKPKETTPFPTEMLKHLNAYPSEVQKQLFSQSELKDFYQLANIIDRTKGTVKLAENPSGTAQNLVTFATGGAILKHPLAMAPTVLSTRALASLYQSKLGRQYLLEGLITPVHSSKATALAAKLGGIAGVDLGSDLLKDRGQ